MQTELLCFPRISRRNNYYAVMFPFPGLCVIAWSALSFLMGVTVYYELQHNGDSLYHDQQALLSRFPMDTTHYPKVGCNGMPAPDCNHADPCTGLTAFDSDMTTTQTENKKSHDSTQLSYLMNFLPKIYYSIFLRKEEVIIIWNPIHTSMKQDQPQSKCRT